MRVLARLLHCTEGQAYSLTVITALAAVLVMATIPAIAGHRRPPAPRTVPFQDLSGSGNATPLSVEEGGFAVSPGAQVGPALPRNLLPVGEREGGVAAVSFVRLSGQGRILRLAVDRARSLGEAAAQLEMCPIQSATWVAGGGLPMAQAPRYDCTAGSPGVRLPDGSWAFDLGRFPDRAGSDGFAIVPQPHAAVGPGGPVTFTVTLIASVTSVTSASS